MISVITFASILKIPKEFGQKVPSLPEKRYTDTITMNKK